MQRPVDARFQHPCRTLKTIQIREACSTTAIPSLVPRRLGVGVFRDTFVPGVGAPKEPHPLAS